MKGREVLLAWYERLYSVGKIGWGVVHARISDFWGFGLFFDEEWESLVGLCTVPRG